MLAPSRPLSQFAASKAGYTVSNENGIPLPLKWQPFRRDSRKEGKFGKD